MKRNLMNKETIRKNIGFIIATALLILLIAGCLSINVYSQSAENVKIADKHAVDLLEREYISSMKNILERYGCEYAGITMTKVYGEDYNDYEVLIHHSNLKYLDEEQKNRLLSDLEHLVRDFPNTVFTFEFSI